MSSKQKVDANGNIKSILDQQHVPSILQFIPYVQCLEVTCLLVLMHISDSLQEFDAPFNPFA
jgi:hypothetical protein